MQSERNITRIDHGRTHGWWVRFYRGRAGAQRCVSKLFSDSMHGGKRKALAKARRWRDRAAPGIPPTMRPRGKPPGYGYVRRAVTMQKAQRWPRFVAWVKLAGGRVASTSYSVTRWGEVGAKLKAEKWLKTQQRAARRATV